MDVEFWASRVHSAKHLSAARAARLNSGTDNLCDSLEGDEDTRACFPCPFCYVEIEIHSLCSHLHEEHCFDLKNAVCPLCAANLGIDVMGHFVAQHTNSLKRRRKSQKSGLWSGTGLGKELSSFLISPTEGRGHEEKSNAHCDAATLDLDTRQIQCSNIEMSMKSTDPSSQDKNHKKDIEERRQKAEFLKQLIFSTIF